MIETVQRHWATLNNTLKVFLISIALVIIGSGIFALHYLPFFEGRAAAKVLFREVFHEVGSLLAAFGLLHLIWDLTMKRSFRDEVLTDARQALAVEAAGLVHYSNSFIENMNWDLLFKNATQIDLFFSFANSWRGTQRGNLARFIQTSGAKLRVILPDPNDETVMAELDRRFNYNRGEAKRGVEDAIKYFSSDLRALGKQRAKVEIYLVRKAPLHTLYRFNDKVVYAPFNHLEFQGTVPAFTGEKGGGIYAFAVSEFDSLIKVGKKVWPNDTRESNRTQ